MIKENKIAVIGLSGESIFIKVDHFHEDGETIIGQTFNKEYGGKGYNQAVAAKRFEAKVSFLTLVGDDDIGNEVEKSLDKEGIKNLCIKRLNSKSAYACIIIDKNGNNQVTCYPGVSSQMTKEDVLLFENEIATSKYLLLQLETSDEALVQAIELAKKYDTLIILNPAPAHKLPHNILKDCYLITPNEQEFKTLFDVVANEENLLKIDLKNIIVTLGNKGSLLKKDNQVIKIDAINVNAVNTTGAGDTYNGVLTASLLEGYNLIDAAKLASMASSISVTREFVIDSIPYKEEILKKYKSNL